MKLKASIMSQTKTYNSFLHIFATVRRRKLLVAVRVQSSLVATDIWSPSNWSERCSRTVCCQKTRIILKKRHGTFAGLSEESPRVSKTIDHHW